MSRLALTSERGELSARYLLREPLTGALSLAAVAFCLGGVAVGIRILARLGASDGAAWAWLLFTFACLLITGFFAAVNLFGEQRLEGAAGKLRFGVRAVGLRFEEELPLDGLSASYEPPRPSRLKRACVRLTSGARTVEFGPGIPEGEARLLLFALERLRREP